MAIIISYEITSGTIPPGLTLVINGDEIDIDGTPTATGTVDFTVTAVDDSGATATRDYTLTVTDIDIEPGSLPDAFVGEDYLETIFATGGDGSDLLMSYVITGGATPPGIEFLIATVGTGTGTSIPGNEHLTVIGTPTSIGSVAFTVFVTDGTSTASRPYTLTVDREVLPLTVADVNPNSTTVERVSEIDIDTTAGLLKVIDKGDGIVHINVVLGACEEDALDSMRYDNYVLPPSDNPYQSALVYDINSVGTGSGTGTGTGTASDDILITGIEPNSTEEPLNVGEVLDATDTSPIVLEVDSWDQIPLVGSVIKVKGVEGNTAANGVWTVEDSDSTTVTLKDSTGNGVFLDSPDSQVYAVGAQVIVLVNVSDRAIVLSGNDSDSNTNNQFRLPPAYGTQITLQPNDTIVLWWDECQDQVWKVLSCTVQASSGVSAGGVNLVTTTTYTFQQSDNGKIVAFSNASTIAVTLPLANTLSSTWYCSTENRNNGVVTITRSGSNDIDGSNNVILNHNEGIEIYNDGVSSYTSMRGKPIVPVPFILASGQASPSTGQSIAGTGAGVDYDWTGFSITGGSSSIISISSGNLILAKVGYYQINLTMVWLLTPTSGVVDVVVGPSASGVVNRSTLPTGNTLSTGILNHHVSIAMIAGAANTVFPVVLSQTTGGAIHVGSQLTVVYLGSLTTLTP